MDLMFDSQVLGGHRQVELSEPVLASIAGYYRRATTTARPMSYLIALAMVILLCTLLFQWLADPGWLPAVSAVLAGMPILLAAARTVRNARRLGARIDGAVEQSRLARAVFRDHVMCAVSMSAFLVVWVAA
jgi:hypothetical protein